MKKIASLFFALTFFIGANAQQYVSTEVENRNLLIEEFTGRDCPNCPAGHIISSDIIHTNEGHAWSIGIHTGYFAPTTYPNLNTDISAVLVDPYDDVNGGLGYPAAVLNRSTEQAVGRGQWRDIAAEVLQQTAECNVAGHVVINPITRVATITTEVYYTANSNESTNYLTIVMVQDSIIGQQAYANTNPEQYMGDDMYCHLHVLRDVVTEDWGDEIAPTTAGSLVTKTYEYTIPEIIGDPNGVEVDMDNIYFIAFVTEKYQGIATRPILNVNKLSQNYSSGEAISPYMADIVVDEGIFCKNERTFKNYVRNVGSEEITSMKFEVSYEGGETIEQEWNGNIASDQTERIDFTFDIPVGENDFTFDIVEVNGEAFDYSKTVTYNCDEWNTLTLACVEETEVTIEILQDKYGNHTSWEFLSSDNIVLASDGPYMYLPNADSELHTYTVTVRAGECYKFVIYDSYGNGLDGGYYRILDDMGNVVVDGSGEFTDMTYSVLSVELGASLDETMTSSSLNVYPNPVNDFVKLSKVNGQFSMVKIYNMIGMLIDEIQVNSDEIEINISDYNPGIYFFNVDGESVKVIKN